MNEFSYKLLSNFFSVAGFPLGSTLAYLNHDDDSAYDDDDERLCDGSDSHLKW